MYNAHFGFREKPFKLVPNPEFLYLSNRHEIALAHLAYAVSQGDGFVVITGEVGTGKTTLCRNFLERLAADVESAYVFNPVLNSVQLLSTICNEFGIHTESRNLKQLLDLINGYLILKNRKNRKVVLLIDEAQNLSLENLEMVRLLSNLETTRDKLIQIVLVGQPELGNKLDSYQLRQLAQRISLRSHLIPLGAAETAGYIRHRINIAAQRQVQLFSRGAIRRIFKYSGGIPRLINIACDRALLTAYSLDKHRVTAAIAKAAVGELSAGGSRRDSSWPAYRRVGVWGGAILGALFLAVGVFRTLDLRESVTRRQWVQVSRSFALQPAMERYPIPERERPAAPVNLASAQPGTSVIRIPDELNKTVAELNHPESRMDAVASLLHQWRSPLIEPLRLPEVADDARFFETAARLHGMRSCIVRYNLQLVRKLNLPAVIALDQPGSHDTVYLAMVRWNQGRIRLAAGSRRPAIDTDLETLLPFLNGTICIFWINPLKVEGIVSDQSPAEAAGAIRTVLRQIGYSHLEAAGGFDREVREAVIDFQNRHGLVPDGLVGPVTKMFLIKEAGYADWPYLDADAGEDGP